MCFTLLILTASCQDPSKQPKKIKFCDDANFNGQCKTILLDDGNCFDLTAVDMSRRVVSINTHDNCVYLCSKDDCEGERVRVAPGTPSHNDLGFINFGRKAVSVMECQL